MAGIPALKRFYGHKCLRCGGRLQRNRLYCFPCIKRFHRIATQRKHWEYDWKYIHDQIDQALREP